jgi:arabinogalactan oligomer/maltooligosaccharide transport system substrate-binding protein
MSLRKTTRFLPLMTVVALVLAACAAASPSASEEPAESVAPSESQSTFPTGDISIEMWHKEGDLQLPAIEALTDAYTELHPNVTFTLVNKEVGGTEAMREDMVNTALDPSSQPELVWTVLDHVGPFVEAGVIQPLDGLFDESVLADAAKGSGTFVDPATGESHVWVAPISIGNQLMLYYNKEVIADAPADTDAMIAVAHENSNPPDSYGILYRLDESFWLVPWLGGFGASVFADDGVTPTLNTPEVQAALQFMYDLKFTEGLLPTECDYNCMNDGFKNGITPMIINGDWALGEYSGVFGDNLGVAPIPKVTSTGMYPAPYIGGVYYMIPSSVEGDTLTVVRDFIDFTLSFEQQVNLTEALQRLPSNAQALADPVVTGSPALQGAGEAVAKGTPQPINVEMRCIFDAMNTGIRDVHAGNSDVEAVSEAMQTAANNCIAAL